MRPTYSRCFSGPRSRGALENSLSSITSSEVASFPPRIAVLVVFELAVANQETALLEADSRTVLIVGACAAKLDTFDDVVSPAEDPDRLAFGDGPPGVQHRLPADAPNPEALLRPHGDVASVGLRRDLDFVAVSRRLGRVGDTLKLETRYRPSASRRRYARCMRGRAGRPQTRGIDAAYRRSGPVHKR